MTIYPKNSQKCSKIEIFRLFYQTSNCVRNRPRCRLEALWSSLEPPGSILLGSQLSIDAHVSAHMRHTKGTSCHFVAICCFLLPTVPDECTYSVPGVCAYFFENPSSNSRSGLSNAVSQVILRQKLISVVQFQIWSP